MNKKLIVRISEGLGNQLFMYANAYSLSKKIDYDLYVDNESSYRTKNIRSYLLNNFKISANIASQNLMYNSYKKIFLEKLKFNLINLKITKNF